MKEIYPLKIGIKEEEKFCIMDHILDNETAHLLSTCLKMMMLMIIGMKGNRCPGIFQQFERFLEMTCINLFNTVKLVRNRHLRFLKKGLQKPGVPLDSMFL